MIKYKYFIFTFGVYLLILAACAEMAIAPPSPTPDMSRNKLGVHLLLSDGQHDWPVDIWPLHLEYARQAVGAGGYVIELIRLDDLDPARWQTFQDLCATLNLTPVIRLATTHDPGGGWRAPPMDDDGRYQTVAKQYANFIDHLEWSGPLYVIVGNEPNHGNEWGGRPAPAQYARFLVDVAEALHQTDPRVKVLNAGFDAYTPHTGDQPFIDGQFYMDSETFMDEMVAAEPDVFSHIDIWASHPYPLGPFIEGPWQQTYQVDWLNGVTNPAHQKPEAGINNRGINSYEWELWKLSTYGVEPMPVLITETGWRHAESVDPNSPDNGRPLPDNELMAQYLDLALQGNNGRYPDLPETGWTPWLSDERVMGVVFFAFNGHPSIWGHTNWLILEPDGAVLDTYAPFRVLADIGNGESY